MRRAERSEDPWSGHWSLPGGQRQADDPDLLHTALRELEEECGIRLGREHLQAAYPSVVARRRTGAPFVTVAPFLFRVDHELPTVLDSREATDALWISRDILLDPGRHVLQTVPRYPPEVRFPAIELKGIPLWGFTYRVLMQYWLGVVPQHAISEQAGFETAAEILDFLLAQGLALKQGWSDRLPQQAPRQSKVIRSAVVAGSIPAAAVLARFSGPGRHVANVNILEVRPHQIRVTGLNFEEYLISATGETPST